MDFDKLKIMGGKYWDVFLHQDQTALGRLYFWYKDELSDLLTVPQEAFDEFYSLGNTIKSALSSAFAPDLFNYYSLSNKTSHLHVHIIPRYSRKVKMFGYEFKDAAFGEGYKRNPEFVVDEDTLIKIKDAIKEKL